jgi:hypothetical protein
VAAVPIASQTKQIIIWNRTQTIKIISIIIRLVFPLETQCFLWDRNFIFTHYLDASETSELTSQYNMFVCLLHFISYINTVQNHQLMKPEIWIKFLFNHT